MTRNDHRQLHQESPAAAVTTNTPAGAESAASFDRVTRLAARLVDAPIALLCLADEPRGRCRSGYGVPDSARMIEPLACEAVLRLAFAGEEPVLIGDLGTHAGAEGLDALRPLGVMACAVLPLRAADGGTVGALCVIDSKPRRWTDVDVEIMAELAASAERETRVHALARELSDRVEEGARLIEQLQNQAGELEAQAAELEQQVEEVEELNAALSDSEQRFRALAEADVDGIVTVDRDSTILYVNASLARMFGYSEEELLGRPLASLMPERFRTAHHAGTARYIATGKRGIPWRAVQVDGLRSDGTEFPIEINFGEYQSNGGQIFAGFITDITERKRVEAALNAAKDEAERANQAKSDFLSRMSHELRTPLNSILGFGQLLERKELAADQSKGVEHILKAGRHLLNLINEVLEIARIEANRQEFSLEPVRARSVLDEALDLIRPTALEASIRLGYPDPTDVAGVFVRADQQRLMQVMLNLLSNAVKYNSRNGSLDMLVRRSGSPGSGGTLAIGVRDTGPGIAADRLEELFVPFSRLGAEEAGIEGTGLGLVLSKRLVEAMGGSLTVESEPGQGSTFWVELPLVDDPLRTPRPEPASPPPAPTGPRPPRTVLYVEDNLANLDLVESILQSRPEIRLIPASRGQLGLQAARAHSPDLILLDLHLPDLNGDAVLRELANDPATRPIPVLVISADATPRQIERLRGAGVRDYLTKPIDVGRFLTTVDAALALAPEAR